MLLTKDYKKLTEVLSHKSPGAGSAAGVSKALRVSAAGAVVLGFKTLR